MSCVAKLKNGSPCGTAAIIDGLCGTHYLVERENSRRAGRGERPLTKGERKDFLKAERERNAQPQHTRS